jgi:hypothetical protein
MPLCAISLFGTLRAVFYQQPAIFPGLADRKTSGAMWIQQFGSLPARPRPKIPPLRLFLAHSANAAFPPRKMKQAHFL